MLQTITGHNIDELRKLPAGSVHVIICSPPYFGLRDYKIPPSIWGGDENCEHDFSVERVTGEIRTGKGLAEFSKQYRGGGKKAGRVPLIEAERGFCAKCGAWRGCLGLEPSPELYVQHLVMVFHEAKRVLRDEGTLWINLGDSSAGARSGPKREMPHMDGRAYDSYLANGRVRVEEGREIPMEARPSKAKRIPRGSGRWNNGGNIPAYGDLKPKDLIGIPWMVAFALRADGWWLRSRIPWIKRNPMPESADDRPTVAIEDVFLLAKSERYFYDGEAVKMAASLSSHARMSQNVASQNGSQRANQRDADDRRPMKAGGRSPGVNPKAIVPDGLTKQNTSFSAAVVNLVGSRSRRNSDWFFESWQGLLTDDDGEPLALIVNTAPFKEAHFATFPPKLVEPMILAGTSSRGCCEACGAPWARIVEKGVADLAHQRASGGDANGEYDGEAVKEYAGTGAQNASEVKARILAGMRESKTVGWFPTCKCASPHDAEPNTKFAKKSNANRVQMLRDAARARGEEYTSRSRTVGFAPTCDCARTERKPYGVRSLTSRRIEGATGERRRNYYREHWQRRIDARFPKTKPCTVIDFFGGSGTTAKVALELGRQAITIDLSADYNKLAEKRTEVTPALPLF